MPAPACPQCGHLLPPTPSTLWDRFILVALVVAISVTVLGYVEQVRRANLPAPLPAEFDIVPNEPPAHSTFIRAERVDDGVTLAVYPIRDVGLVVACRDEAAVKEFGWHVIHPQKGKMDELFRAGKIFIIQPGTRIRVTENHFYLLFAEVLDGQYKGRAAVLTENMAKYVVQ
ncbi:MAG: hypothetical protein U0798_15360 [Gemmataceae bacterium]